MNHLIILASPRKNGTSAMLCNILKERTSGTIVKLCHTSNIIEQFIQANVIILVGPCYINSYPGDVVDFFCKLANYSNKDKIKGKKMYAVIQGGMPYIHTHNHALKMTACFCNQMNMDYMGGFVFGGGPVLDGRPLLKLPIKGKATEKAFNQFCDFVYHLAPSPDSLYTKLQLPIKGITAWFVSKILSYQSLKKIRQHGLDPNLKSPYIR